MNAAAAMMPTIVPRMLRSKMVASAERAGDDATNQRSADSQEQSQRHADPLRSRQHEPREDADNEPDEDETENLDRLSRVPRDDKPLDNQHRRRARRLTPASLRSNASACAGTARLARRPAPDG